MTGGAGFIGSHLVEKLLADGHAVAILDDFNDFYDPKIKHDNIAAVADQITVHHADLRDARAVNEVFRREKVETVIHLAARAGVRPSIGHPQLYYDTNVNGTLHILEAARTVGVERFIFASSSSVYGVSKTVQFLRTFTLRGPSAPTRPRKSQANFSAPPLASLPDAVVALRFFTSTDATARSCNPQIHPANLEPSADRPIW